jgi:transaldolase
MTVSIFQQLHDCGQSLWMDYLSRQMLESGELGDRIHNQVLRGITSNPSIFQKAMTGNEIYKPAIEWGIQQNLSPQAMYEMLAFEDIRRACDILRPVYEESDGADGYVSMEVSPHLARDTDGTLEEARRFYRDIDRDNVMIKIPGTPEGMGAIEQAIAEGINVNVTLLFSVEMYRQAALAYIRGLERRIEQGQPIDNIGSVASFFLSRIDTKVDDRIDSRLRNIGSDDMNVEKRLESIKGKVAIANAKVAYQTFLSLFSGDRWQRLVDQGAKQQRLLWASTSTKNPDYSDVRYVDELIGPDTVNTMPESTIEAFGDHGTVTCDAILTGAEEAKTLLNSLSDSDIQINLDGVMDELLEEGIQKFVKPYDALLESLESKVKQLIVAK